MSAESAPLFSDRPERVSPYCVVYVTCSTQDEAQRIATAVVSQQLAACVNILPGIQSVYQWEGQLCQESEFLLIIKTLSKKVPALQQTIQGLHSYSVPEFVVLPIIAGSEPYLRWMTEIDV
jgi:periplasmic divalent cation tolerance protein